MSHLAFARKYRPRTFAEVVGQEAIADALKGAVSRGQTAPVYLFSGSHGVGKTSMARIFAKALDCPNQDGGEPCLACETCKSIDLGEALDVIEIDAASNRKIEDARRIRENVLYRPQAAPFKVYILDEVHQLTREAFDALLKTFEEAPSHVRFVLATTELHKVPTTIRSRSQVFHFRRATREDVERRLGQIAGDEQVEIDSAALSLITRRARGSMRDAQKMLDQVVTLGAGEGRAIGTADVARLLGAFTSERIERLLGAIAAGKGDVLLAEVAGHIAEGGQVATFLDELMDALRAALYLQTCGAESPVLDDFAYERGPLIQLAEALSPEALLLGLSLLADAEQKLRLAREPRVLLEVCLVRLARAGELRPLGEVLARLERLEQALGAPPAEAAVGPPGSRGRGARSSPPEVSGARTSGGPSPTSAQPQNRAARPTEGPPRQAQDLVPGPPRGHQDAPPRGYDQGPPRGYDQGPPRGYDQGPPRGYDQGPPREPQRSGYQQGPPREPQRSGYRQGPPREPQQRSGYQQGPPREPQPAGYQARAREQPPERGRRRASYAVPDHMQAGGRASALATHPEHGQRLAPPAAPAARADSGLAPSAPRAQPSSAGAGLTPAALPPAWAKVKQRLPDALGGIPAEALLNGKPRVNLIGPGKVGVEVELAGFSWRRLNEDRPLEVLRELLSEALGQPVQVELARREAQKVTQGESIYDHPIVQLAQRETDARPMMG